MEDRWHEAVVNACMAIECGYEPDNPEKTINNIINWHVELALENMMDVWKLVDIRDRINGILKGKE